MTDPHRVIEDLDQVIRDVIIEMPTVPESAIVFHARRAIVDFCDASHYWLEDIGPVRVSQGRDTYDLPISRSFGVVSVLSVTASNGNGDENRHLQRSNDENVKYRFTQRTPFTISVNPSDDLDQWDLSIIAALRPVEVSGRFRFSEVILGDYYDAIVAGTKYRLYKIPQKDWTDLQQAAVNQGVFDELTRAALRQQGRGFSRLPTSGVIKSRRFY